MILYPHTPVYVDAKTLTDSYPTMHLSGAQGHTRCGREAHLYQRLPYEQARREAQGCRECFLGVSLG